MESTSAVAREVRALRYPRLDINGAKTTYVTMKFHRRVTGLTLANDGRVTIGWKKKRELRVAVNRASKGLLSVEELHHLSGYLAFVNVAEPEFLKVLSRVYGEQVIRQIQHTVAVRGEGSQR